MVLQVDYKQLIQLLDIMDKKGYHGTTVFGSFILPYYAKKIGGIEIGPVRETGDIDVAFNNEDNNEELDSLLITNIGDGVGITPEGSYYERLDGIDGFIEFFPKGTLESIDPKFSGKLESFLFDPDSTEEFKNQMFPKPWLGLAMKIAAYRKGHNKKHLTDTIYLRGIMGDSFNETLSTIEEKGFRELVGVYKEYMSPKHM